MKQYIKISIAFVALLAINNVYAEPVRAVKAQPKEMLMVTVPSTYGDEPNIY